MEYMYLHDTTLTTTITAIMARVENVKLYGSVKIDWRLSLIHI